MDAVVLSWTFALYDGMVDCVTVLFIGMNVMKDGLNGGLNGWAIYLDGCAIYSKTEDNMLFKQRNYTLTFSFYGKTWSKSRNYHRYAICKTHNQKLAIFPIKTETVNRSRARNLQRPVLLLAF